MKRTGILCAALAGVWLCVVPAAQAQEKQVAEQIVAVVGNSMILLSEVNETAKTMAEERRQQGYTSDRDPMCEALETLLMQKMLANQARLDSLEVNTGGIENAIENHVNGLIDQYGSLKALESVYRKPVYQIRDELRDHYMDMQLAQMMEMDIRGKVAVIPSEVEKFYRGVPKDSLPMVPEQYVYAQIVMYPPSTEQAKLRARERLLEMRQRIINGDRFDMLARFYSVDGSASRGGEMDPMPKEGFVRPFAEALEKLKPGQTSEVVETEYGFHLIELLEKKNNLYRCRHILIRPEFTPEELTVSAHRLDSIANAIRHDSLSFEEAAARFSEDKYSKMNGGVVSNHELVELYQADARRASTRFFREDLGPDYQYLRNLKPGEVSESFQSQDLRGNQLSKIVILKEIVPSHRANIGDDYTQVEEMALKAKQDKHYREWLEKKMAAMYIRIDPRFRNCDFENKGWVK